MLEHRIEGLSDTRSTRKTIHLKQPETPEMDADRRAKISLTLS